MRPDVVYTVIFLKDKNYLGAPTVLGEFGREVCVEVPNEMRVLVVAMAPNQEGRSFTCAKMLLFEKGAWQQVKEMTMEAYLSKTPSFEFSVQGTPYRFVVMPRMIVPAAGPDRAWLKDFTLLSRVVFFAAIAAIPVATDRTVADFMLARCMPGSGCSKQVMPLLVNIGIVTWAAYALLWPLAAWFLGGRWLVTRLMASRKRRSGVSAA
jgi:hypothetical protein